MTLDEAPILVVAAHDAVDPGEPGRGPRRSGGRAWRDLTPDARFRLGILLAVGLGAAVRFIYLFTAAPTAVYGDGLDYHLSALRLADGHGYTWALQEIGLDSGPTTEAAHHPPGWVTVVGAVSELGGRSNALTR